MSHYSYLRGWLEFSHESKERIREIIEGFPNKLSASDPTPEKANHYLSGWTFQPQPTGAMGYVFYGQEIRTEDVKYLEELVQVLSENVTNFDGEYTDHIRGVFHLDTEDEQETSVWLIRQGGIEKHKEQFLFE